MKKTLRRTVIFVLCGVLFAGVLLIYQQRQKHRWKRNVASNGTKEVKIQEFVYHSSGSSKKVFEPSSSENPNIILISLDTLRAQSMGCYGFTKETTPFMDQIAKEGVLFENMCAAATSTPPSHMSMMTGLYRSVHGVFDRQVLDEHVKTLPELLSEAHYATGAVTEDGFLVRDMGFGRGFDDYYEIKDVEDLFDKQLLVGGFAKDVFERGKNWIDERRDQKFFLFLHTYEVHDPYYPPPPYDTMFLENPDNYDSYFRKYSVRKGRVNCADFPPEFIRAHYEGEIRYVDDIMKEFITFLKNRGLGEKTLVIITSDHGEELFEHKNMVGHGFYTYDTEALIPYIMWMPGKIPSGIRIKHQVSNVDILPTIVDFLHLDFEDTIQGYSLYPLIRTPQSPDERHVFCEAVLQNCVRSFQYKFIDSNELYFFNEDPGEQSNQAEVQKELCVASTQLLGEFKEQCQSLKTQKGLLGEPRTSLTLTEEDLKKLGALGYLE